jgi:anti-sigma factor RsiW
MSDVERQRYEELLVRAVDDALSAEEQRELEAYLGEHPEAVEERAAHLEIKAITDAAVERILADARLEPPRPGPAGRLVLGLGFAALLLASLAVVGLGIWAFVIDPTLPWTLKLLAGLGAAGVLTLFAYALMTRLRSRRADPYREIDR